MFKKLVSILVERGNLIITLQEIDFYLASKFLKNDEELQELLVVMGLLIRKEDDVPKDLKRQL